MEFDLAIRGSKGIKLLRITPEMDIRDGIESFPDDTSGSCKVMIFSSDGLKFAWSTGQSVWITIYEGTCWKPRIECPHPRVSLLHFSSKGSFLASCSNRMNNDDHNLQLWNASTGVLLYKLQQKKMYGWTPQWSFDETILARSINNEIHFYSRSESESNPWNLNETSNHKLTLPKIESFSLSPSGKYVVVFIKGGNGTGTPSFCKFFEYPNFKAGDIVANKSVYFAEKVQAEWNKKGNCVLLLSQAEVDNSNASYYGKQQLHFMNSKGETMNVSLSKEGPIYHVVWSPCKDEFCAVYGFMPAKVTLFNHKCDKIFDFGTGPRNIAYFNPQGTLLLLGGFGNIQGFIEIWNLQKQRRVSSFQAPNSTDLKWCPDGERFITSTCAPRLRQSNGYKIWHYSSSLLYESSVTPPEELWEVLWRNPKTPCPPFSISTKVVKGIESTTPVASKEAYRPPGARKGGNPRTVTLHEDEPAENEKTNKSKSANKNKKRVNKKVKEGQENHERRVKSNNDNDVNDNDNETEKKSSKKERDPIKLKMRKLNKTLDQIRQLKMDRDEGKTLDINQIEKIGREQQILDEIANLQL